MARSQSKPRGAAGQLARELARNPTPELVRRINAEHRGTAASILGTLTTKQQARLGLAIGDRGQVVLSAAGIESVHSAIATEHLPSTPIELAKALNKAKPVIAPTVNKGSPLYVIGYGEPVSSGDASRVWDGVVATSDRINVMRRIQSIRIAEVSGIAHSGTYDQVRGGTKSVLSRHADKLLDALIEPAPHNERIRWERRGTEGGTHYKLQYMPVLNDQTEQVLVAVKNQQLGEAMETDALLMQFGQDTTRYRSPGRRFSVSADTVFAIHPDLASELSEGINIEVDEPYELQGDPAIVLADFIYAEDTPLVAPAYTRFIVEQQFATA
jgi:hypothetical protein